MSTLATKEYVDEKSSGGGGGGSGITMISKSVNRTLDGTEPYRFIVGSQVDLGLDPTHDYFIMHKIELNNFSTSQEVRAIFQRQFAGASSGSKVGETIVPVNTNRYSPYYCVYYKLYGGSYAASYPEFSNTMEMIANFSTANLDYTGDQYSQPKINWSIFAIDLGDAQYA